MATIINNPGDGDRSNGWIVAVLSVLAFLLIIFFVFPAVFGDDGGEVDVVEQTPAGNTGSNNNQGTGQGASQPPIINNTTFNSSTTINTATTTED